MAFTVHGISKGDCKAHRMWARNGVLSVQAKMVSLTPRGDVVAAGDCSSEGGSRQVL